MYYRNERSVYPNLFVYGSLCLPKLMSFLAGRQLHGCPARLHGYASYFLQARDYPALRVATGRFTTGILYRNVPRRILNMIDRFEDDFYIRVSCRCELISDREFLEAQVYVINLRSLASLSSKPWKMNPVKARSLIRKLTARHDFTS